MILSSSYKIATPAEDNYYEHKIYNKQNESLQYEVRYQH